MDDHHPAGFGAARLGSPATIFHHAPSPYGIPYRSLYSQNIENLMFAGRDASCTHAAMSSTRVMGTGCSMGQAVGTAAAMAVRAGLTPREVGRDVKRLQQLLLADDAYLPWVRQEFGELARRAKLTASQGDPSPLCDGVNRPVGDDLHAWVHRPGDSVAMEFDRPEKIERATLILDSALDKEIQMSWHQGNVQLTSPPPEMPRTFRLEARVDGQWRTLADVRDNHQRLFRAAVPWPVEGLRYTLESTWGPVPSSKLFAFYVD